MSGGEELCTPTMSTNSYARASSEGTVELHWGCGSTLGIADLGALKVGDTRTCASADQSGACTDTGTFSMESRSGESWVTGKCTCTSTVDQSVSTTTFDVPYRFVF
jgi:hypothetical protein